MEQVTQPDDDTIPNIACRALPPDPIICRDGLSPGARTLVQARAFKCKHVHLAFKHTFETFLCCLMCVLPAAQSWALLACHLEVCLSRPNNCLMCSLPAAPSNVNASIFNNNDIINRAQVDYFAINSVVQPTLTLTVCDHCTAVV